MALHCDEGRWALLYRLVWRLTHGEPKLLEIAVDPDVARAFDLQKSVRHDIHKMRAFVRFREVQHGDGKWFVAWFEPAHHIVEHNARFFVDRFASMRWSILTPERCAHWDGSALSFTAGVDQIAGADGGRGRVALADVLRKYFQPCARESARDAGRDAEEILAESAGGGADSIAPAGSAGTGGSDGEKKREQEGPTTRSGIRRRVPETQI